VAQQHEHPSAACVQLSQHGHVAVVSH